MALYMITYDAHHRRQYTDLYDLMATWKAERIAFSVWLVELRGPAETIRDFVIATLDNDDSVAVIELPSNGQWATIRAEPGGVEWLKVHIPFRHD